MTQHGLLNFPVGQPTFNFIYEMLHSKSVTEESTQELNFKENLDCSLTARQNYGLDSISLHDLVQRRLSPEELAPGFKKVLAR